jgi:hypothetical protein
MNNQGYCPTGAKCRTCVFKMRDCDSLPFHKMKVVERCKVSLIKMVDCSEYIEKSAN